MQTASVTAIISLLIFQSFSLLLVSSYDHTLKQGEKLNSSSYLVSAKRVFTLGFYTPENSHYSYLGIWFTTNITWNPVWLANRDIPVYKDSAIFTITSAGEVIIAHDRADPIELYSAKSGTNITATLLDSGNLVVKEIETNGSSEGKVLWQSFDYPTDVLLPGMKLGVSRRTGRNWTLTSWFSGNNPASGAFTLEWDSIRRRLVIRRRGMVYWTSGDLKLYYEGNNLKLHAFDYMFPKPEGGKFNYNFMNVSNQDEQYFTYSLFLVPYLTDEAQRNISSWRLDYQGNVKDYDMPPYRDYIAQADKCYGYNNKGYYSGCELWEIPKCRNRYQEFSLEHGNFGFTVDYLFDNSSKLSHSDCRDSCWNDCNCVGFKEEEIGCSYWRGKNARFNNNYYSRTRTYVIISVPPKKRAIWKWILISAAIVVFLLSILGATSFFLLRKYKEGRKKKIEELQELEELMKLEGYTEESEFENDGGKGPHLRSFTYASILASTNCFSLSNKLGEGGFGPVYKGKMVEGREIAIKLLSRRSEQGLLEFKTELILISKLQHRNLVKLLDFCIHKNEKMIIYDYMPNGSLDFYLFDPAKSGQLNWERRFNIIEGIAQGLLYLHKYSRVMIVHRDLKASNILFDENMNPKISDFGMARIFKRDVAEANTYKRAGTYGYMAPEYAMQGIFSVKSDIYSFGVLIL
ncbi:Non-specific serine/threonine protein kinase [Handroanthus impetiginosus]|uniref:non-specific serine/threonine protein kinase n=1 Tax=Handroanthus impetiginosus TaxID=429701 RepID=A0A2G9HVN0_9LAMI|nr:Non-specific serine/threonine protein kinase [Handroanthus impetiginosus]